MTTDTPAHRPIHGYCAPDFKAVKDAFINNFKKHDELGASCCLYIGDDVVVDLWGGWADIKKTKPWLENTLSGFYSVGKALVSICALHACDQYQVDLDAPVAQVWPEYAANGKAKTTLRHFLSHGAAMPAIRTKLRDEDLYDWDLIVRELAAQKPYWKPGTRPGYHTNTFGFLVGEVIKRISGMSPGQYLQKYIATPLNADVHFGLNDCDLKRSAEIDWPGAEEVLTYPENVENMDDETLMRLHAYRNPSGISSIGVANTDKWRQIEVPSTNGFGTAKGLARVFSALAMGGEREGHRIIQKKSLAEATRLQRDGIDIMLGKELRWGLGFQLTHPNRPLGPNPNSFGHFGNGGSLGFADPDVKMGFGYTMNHIVRDWGSPQNRALIKAAYSCL